MAHSVLPTSPPASPTPAAPQFHPHWADRAALWAAWSLTRLLLVGLSMLTTNADGDVIYYWWAYFGDDPTTMTEYPAIGTWPTAAVAWLSGGDLDLFYQIFVTFCLSVDLIFFGLLQRGAVTPQRWRAIRRAGWWWCLFGLAAGPVFILRLDLFPALAVAASAALLFSRPRAAAAVLALATTMKLWPGVLAAGLVGRFNQAQTWHRLVAFFGSLLGLCALTVVFQGSQRLLSPLSYQNVRGLQIESIPATFPMWLAFERQENFAVFYAPSKSFEITGPYVPIALQLSSIAMILTVLGAVAVALWYFLRGGWHPYTTMAFYLAIIAALIVSNKVFSPQYIVWLGPLMAVVLRSDAPPAASQRLHRLRSTTLAALAVLIPIAAAIGTYIYPFQYDYLLDIYQPELAPIGALVLRNCLMMIIAIIAVLWLLINCRNQARTHRAAAGQDVPSQNSGKAA